MGTSLILLLLGCATDAVPFDTGGEQLTLRLVNPTEADPFYVVDTLRLTLFVDGEEVATQEAGWDEPLEMPAMREYGRVRFELMGIGAGRIRSFGRTPELVWGPGQERELPLLFLPVNQAIPLSASMTQPRSEHGAWRLPDGRLLLFGGRSPAGDEAYASLEAYDPGDGSFTDFGASMIAGLVSPGFDSDGATLLIAGGATADGRGTSTAIELSPEGAQLRTQQSMSKLRQGHCFSMFRPSFGLAVGGNSDYLVADYLRPDPNTGEWGWSEVLLDGLDSPNVTGCALLSEGRLFLQGRNPESTGVFDYSAEAAAAQADVRLAYTPASTEAISQPQYVDGAMLIPLGDGDAWVGGGQLVETGQVATTARRFQSATATFAATVDPELPRVDGSWAPWVEEGWFALGCGSADAQTSVELINLSSGERMDPVELDRSRPGCVVSTLDDGALLVTGGFSGSQAGEHAAIIVPYPWETDLEE